MPTIKNVEIDGVTYDLPKEVYFVTDEGYSQYSPFAFAGRKAGIYVFNLALTESTDHYFSYLSGSGVRGQPTRFHPDIVIIPQDVPADESVMSDDDLLGYAFNLVTTLVSGNFIQSAIKFIFKTYKTNKLETESVIYIEKPLVDISSEQAITAKKSFVTLPESSAVPTTDNQLVNKKYADSLNYYLGKTSQYATSANAFDLTNLEPGSYYFMKDSSSNGKLNLKLVHNNITSTVELNKTFGNPISDLIMLSIFKKPIDCPNDGTTIFGSISWTDFPNGFNLNRYIYDLTVSNDNNIVATLRQIVLNHPALLNYANYFNGENIFANKLRALVNPVDDNEVVNKGYLFSLLTDRVLAGNAHIENASSSGSTSTVIGSDYILNTAQAEEPDEGYTVTLANTSGDTKSNVALLLYEDEERNHLIDKILITELEPSGEYPTEEEFLSDDMYVDVFENYVEEIDLNTKTINNVSLKGSGNLTTSDLGINEIKRITSNKNIWELSAGIYIVSGNLNLYYSSSRYFTTCSTGIILYVTGISSGRVSFYAMGRGVESSKSSENTIVVGVAQNNSYGVCDSYNINNLAVTVTTVNNQTIDGVKTFSNLPVSSATPTTNNQLVNKKYVDDTISDEVDSLITYSTTDINPGDALESGSLYIVYE